MPAYPASAHDIVVAKLDAKLLLLAAFADKGGDVSA